MSSVDNTIATDAPSNNDGQTQPSFTEAMAATVTSLAQSMQALDGALIPILHAVQAQFRYIPREAVPIIAECLNLSRADVHGVLTFYHDFQQQPPAATVIKICRAEACQSVGSEALFSAATQHLASLQSGSTLNASATVAIDSVYCLGNCACGPAVMIEQTLYGRVDDQRLQQLITQMSKPSFIHSSFHSFTPAFTPASTTPSIPPAAVK